jgi:hypothetical protein
MTESFEEYSARLLRHIAASIGISYAELPADWPPPVCPKCTGTGWQSGTVEGWRACECPDGAEVIG